MGRHSAGDDEQVDVLPARPALGRPPRPGRHATRDAGSGDDYVGTGPGPGPGAGRAGNEGERPGPKPSTRAAEDTSPIPIVDQPTERIGLVEATIAADADARLEPAVGPARGPGSDQEATGEVASSPLPAPDELDDHAPARGDSPAPVEPAARKKSRIAKGNQATAADVALLRTRADVRNRCIAAVVVPFVLYTAVLFLIGSIHVYLIWVWIPLVTAGVLAGSILDAAHRRAEAGKEDPSG